MLAPYLTAVLAQAAAEPGIPITWALGAGGAIIGTMATVCGALYRDRVKAWETTHEDMRQRLVEHRSTIARLDKEKTELHAKLLEAAQVTAPVLVQAVDVLRAVTNLLGAAEDED